MDVNSLNTLSVNPKMPFASLGFKPLHFLLLFLALNGMPLHADIVLIGSSDVPKLDKRSAKLVFMKKVTTFANGVKAQPLDLPDHNDIKWKFYRTVVGKKPSQVNSYWSRALFTGAGEPPEEVGTQGELVSRINSGSGMIGYVDERYVTSDMNILYRVSD